MLSKLSNWGNSQGLRLPKAVLEQAGLSVGDEVEISVQSGRIIVEPVSRIRGKYRLSDLVARIPDDYQPSEVVWGSAVGKEEW
jgi:antitoxin MazE